MVPSLESLGIDKLSYDERIELIEAIEESLDEFEHQGELPPLPPELHDQLMRRIAVHTDPKNCSTMDQILVRFAAKYPS